MIKRGKHAYLPAVFVLEMKDIMREKNIERENEAKLAMVKYTRVGREVERIYKFDWSKKIPLPSLDYRIKPRRKKQRGII